MHRLVPSLGIVLPCYNEEEILLKTNQKIGELVDRLISEKKIKPESIIAFVDDGSSDKTWELISSISGTANNRVGIKLSRNFGHQAAILAGISHVHKLVDCVITIDADLQDDISVIEEMVLKYSQGFEIVFGVRKKRETDSFFKRNSAKLFYWFMRSLGANIIEEHADFRLASKKVCEKLFLFEEVNLFLRGIFPLIGFDSCLVYYDRQERTDGTTKYPLGKMITFALDGITSFSVKPLRIVSLLGIIIFIVSCFLAVYSLASYFYFGTVPGWTSITLPIYFLGGVQIFSIGIIGEYLGKVYHEVKSRPRFIIETIHTKN